MSNTKQAAYENLRYRIISQLLAPGEQLKDKELMEHYGIGRTPLREVFLELQTKDSSNGFLVQGPGWPP
jgi:DNA-binding GntR family transcriptional regulator